jgi:predicted TIM-barrel fold metal-dependent hydrolase
MISMIINFHEHPGEDVDERMRIDGIDLSVLLPVGSENLTRAIRMSEKGSGRYVPFFWVASLDRIDEACRDLESYVNEKGVLGVKFQPLIQHFFPDDQRLYPFYERCRELSIPVLFHTGVVAFRQELGIPHLAKFGYTIPGIDQIAHEFPDLKVVIAHMGGNYHYEALILTQKHENVYMDTAYLHFFCERMLPRIEPVEMIEHAVKIVGSEKILYGGEGTTPTVIRSSGLSSREKMNILGENARKLLRLSQS